MSTLDLPVLDLSAMGRTADDPGIAELGRVLERWGFVALTGHGVDPVLLERAYDRAQAFFAQPSAAKRRWERPGMGRQRGYTGFGVEHAKDRPTHDLKEFWQVGRPDGGPGLPENVVPDGPERFTETFDALFAALEGVANRFLEAVALHTGLDAPGLLDAVSDGNSVLRVIHYPPLRESDPSDAVRAAAHEDINLVTVLPAATQPGLELQDRDGTWRSLATPPGVLVCDTGDIMQRLTGGRIPATTHRVVNPPGAANVSRYSMPFFVHPRPSWLIRPIAGDAPPIRAGDFLRERLIANGVLQA